MHVATPRADAASALFLPQQNFSKGASQILGQYYQLLRLGRSGYARVCANLLAVAGRLSAGVAALGVFRLLSDDHSLPLVAFSFLPLPDGRPRPYDEFQLADKLRERGWVLPAYRMAPKASHVQLLRAVIREDMSMTMADALLKDIKHALAYLDAHFGDRVTAAAAAAAPEPAAAAAPAAAAEEAEAEAPVPSAVASSVAFREAHAPHRIARPGKKHPGVC